MASNGVESLKGKWDVVDDENFEAFLKEMGVGFAARLVAKNVKPRLIISESGGKWTLHGETPVKTITTEFIPGVKFNETSADGRDVTSLIRFENGKWVHEMVDKNGKVSTLTRYVDKDGLHQIEYTCGSVKARRWYKRIE